MLNILSFKIKYSTPRSQTIIILIDENNTDVNKPVNYLLTDVYYYIYNAILQ